MPSLARRTPAVASPPAAPSLAIVSSTDQPFHPRQLARQKLLSKHAPYSPAARHVGLIVLEHVNQKPDAKGNYSAVPSQACLAEETGYSEKTVWRALCELTDKPAPKFAATWKPLFGSDYGPIERDGQFFGGRGKYRSRHYWILLKPEAFIAQRNEVREKRAAQLAAKETAQAPAREELRRRLCTLEMQRDSGKIADLAEYHRELAGIRAAEADLDLALGKRVRRARQQKQPAAVKLAGIALGNFKGPDKRESVKPMLQQIRERVEAAQRAEAARGRQG